MAEWDTALVAREEDGLDVKAVRDHVWETGSVRVPGAQETGERREALELECDILLPAAPEDRITGEAIGRTPTSIVAEAVHGPTIAEADAAPRDRDVRVLPSIYLDGGVSVSWVKWMKNLIRLRVGPVEKRFQEASHRQDLDAVQHVSKRPLPSQARARATSSANEADLGDSGPEETMEATYRSLRETARRKDTDLRTVACLVAIDKSPTVDREWGIFFRSTLGRRAREILDVSRPGDRSVRTDSPTPPRCPECGARLDGAGGA